MVLRKIEYERHEREEQQANIDINIQESNLSSNIIIIGIMKSENLYTGSNLSLSSDPTKNRRFRKYKVLVCLFYICTSFKVEVEVSRSS